MEGVDTITLKTETQQVEMTGQEFDRIVNALTEAPEPVVDTVSYKWFCCCGAEAVGRMTPELFNEFKEIWRRQHCDPRYHKPCEAVVARLARAASGRPGYAVQLALEERK
jgi:hypothetical protein